ncbi:MAG: flavodoxin family protein [Chloroflexi bacterium]|nr:flavodoxin family protein [Chloroflexota bacterium]
MNVLGISGSPRPNGNTAQAVQHALEILRAYDVETTYIGLASKEITPCDGCLSCNLGKCRWTDDMNEIYEALQRCDGLILGSPVYMGQVSGIMKLMMDRTVMLRTASKFLLSGKVGAGIACGSFRNGGQELTLQGIHNFFLQHDMQVISDGPGYSHYGAAVVGLFAPDEIGKRTVENLARRMAKALQG